MIDQVLISFGVIAATALVHAAFVVTIRPFLWVPKPRRSIHDEVVGVTKLVLIALWLIAAHAVSAALWGIAFYRTGVSPTWEEAFYFALTTYTTLGFGDIVAPQEWRLLTGFSALNGLLMFGLSGAVLVDAAVRLRQPRNNSS